MRRSNDWNWNRKLTFWERMHDYTIGILVPIGIVAMFALVGCIDNGAELGHSHESGKVTITVEIDGELFIVEEKSSDVTVDRHGSSDPSNWEIVKWH